MVQLRRGQRGEMLSVDVSMAEDVPRLNGLEARWTQPQGPDAISTNEGMVVSTQPNKCINRLYDETMGGFEFECRATASGEW